MKVPETVAVLPAWRWAACSARRAACMAAEGGGPVCEGLPPGMAALTVPPKFAAAATWVAGLLTAAGVG